MQKFMFIILFSLLFAHRANGEGAASKWKVEQTNLSDTTEISARFTAVISRMGDPRKVHLNSDVPLTSLKETFVASDKLVVIGIARDTSAVVVFDLIQEKQIDRFFCYQPQRAWDNWIVYIEWYPNHTPERVTDVVLLYDLTKAPAANRLATNLSEALSPLRHATPTRVGIPIYPEANITRRFYQNVVDQQDEVRLILGGPGFLAMPTKNLIFVVCEEPGGDASSILNYLIAVDLSHGPTAVSVKRVSIPEEQFTVKSKIPGYVRITGIQVASRDTVRLSVPKDQYGVESILVDIPK